jgi:hypothetical protein
MTAGLVVALGTLLAACATNDKQITTFQGGACEAFERPPFQVKGATPYDQLWADKATEAGVTGCKWERPAQRPMNWDGTVYVVDGKLVPVLTPEPKPGIVAPLKKEKSLWRRVRPGGGE